jgi:hypothetical protein
MFGNSLGAHHLLYAYLCVWLVQGGYCTWVAVQWMRAKKVSPTTPSQTRDDY